MVSRTTTKSKETFIYRLYKVFTRIISEVRKMLDKDYDVYAMSKDDVMRKAVRQPDKRLHQQVRSEGCYFMSILLIYQIEALYVLSADQINEIYKQGVQEKAIKEDCFINYGGGEMLFQIASSLTGITVRGHWVANFNKGEWTPDKNSWSHGPTHCITRFKRDIGMKRYYHFTYTDFKGNVLWDPIPNSKTATFGTIDGARLYYAVKQEE